MSGLYDDEFAGYRIATSRELDSALREAVVAVDANVLLDLYRFRAQTSHDLIKVLQRLGERLVVPHQALREFWRHRQRTAGSPRTATKTASEVVAKSTRAMTQSLTTWAKQVGLDTDELQRLVDRLEEFTGELQEDLAAVHEDAGARAAQGDPILEQLEQLLEGRVTAALSPNDWVDCVTEGRRRIQAEEPPGYKDADKEEGDVPEGGTGDYLVWYQVTRYAKEQDSDLLIVTRDEKEDWWWRQQSAFLGPRPELALEYHQLSGRRLFLLRPHDLLARAGALQVQVDERSLADADRPSEQEADSPEQWTVEALGALLQRLDREAPVQASALRLAAESGLGRVTREQVYELGDFPDERMLRGFTRPLKRLTQALQEEGLIPAGVLPILVARYPDGVRTSYFSVPPEVPALLVRLLPAMAPFRETADTSAEGQAEDIAAM